MIHIAKFKLWFNTESIKPFLLLFFIFSIFGCSSSRVNTKSNEKKDSEPVGLYESKENESEENINGSKSVNSLLSEDEHLNIHEDNPSIDRHKLLAEIMLFMGSPYKRNGDDNSGFDCSGFTSKVFQNALGVTLPRSTREQFVIGREIDRDSLKFGDLLFFKTTRNTPSHVGIYVGDGLFAHASLKNGVTISLLESEYYKRNYLGARRVIE